MNDTTESSLDFAERWMRDGLAVLRPSFSVMQSTVEMTVALRRLDALRREGVQASTTHLLVSAVARALRANPDLHQVIAGTRRVRPARVNIGLSVSGKMFVSPVLVIEGAEQKTVADIAEETARRMPEAQAADQRMHGHLRRFGWLLPFGCLRRALMRMLFSRPGYRRKGVGDFQVSTVPVDWGLSSVFGTTGVLIGGQLRSQVVVVDGQPAVRPVMTLTLSIDHGVWDGRAASRFMAAVGGELCETPA